MYTFYYGSLGLITLLFICYRILSLCDPLWCKKDLRDREREGKKERLNNREETFLTTLSSRAREP